MDMIFERTIYKLVIYGTEVKFRAPIVKEYKALIKKMEKGDKSEFDLMSEFLVSLGMDKKVIEELEASHLNEIIVMITKGESGKK